MHIEENEAEPTLAPADSLPPAPTRRTRLFHFWRSPAEQPGWARPALLAVAALSTLSYSWGINNTYLESFYGGAARSMSESWHNFIFGAFDPWGTISVDKLPGALWVQALSLRVFGFHVWAIALPQVIEGTLTVLVLYRVVRRIAGAGAGLVAAIVMASSPIVILLDHGNVSDTLLLLLLVLAADATTRAYLTGSLRSLLWAGALVGLAFQTKMLQAWLVLPAFYLAYLLAAPVAALGRRLLHVALSFLVVVIVSLSWMTAVSAVPAQDRPYVDGSCDNSVFSQVFSYNGFARFGSEFLAAPGCHKRSTYITAAAQRSAQLGINTGDIGAGWSRLLTGVFGHDDAWLLAPTVVAAGGLLVLYRRRPRTDPPRAAVVLWSTWLLLSFGFFSAGRYINSYYVAALLPAIGALCGMGAVAVWRHRRSARLRGLLAATTAATAAVSVALVPGYVGLKGWIVASTVAVSVLAFAILLGSLRRGHASVWSITVGPVVALASMLVGSAWASGIVVTEGLGPFNAPYQPAYVNQVTQTSIADLSSRTQELENFVQRIPPSVAIDVIETSSFAGFDILATGREFLPVGGFSGSVPEPSLRQFIRDVVQGHVGRATVATKPLTRNPDLLWVAAHCPPTDRYVDPSLDATFTVYQCAPADARGQS